MAPASHPLPLSLAATPTKEGGWVAAIFILFLVFLDFALFFNKIYIKKIKYLSVGFRNSNSKLKTMGVIYVPSF
jgi:hypothetical protein